MNVSRRQRVEELYQAAADLPADKRDHFLMEQCGSDTALRAGVEELLGYSDSEVGEFLSTPAINPWREEETDRADHPKQVRRYAIVRQIGQGGMGTVYEARQEKPDRTVALKIMNTRFASDRMRLRFEHEVEVLGRLQHSGIAQIFEAGTFDPGSGLQPFFAMELIEGKPLTAWADQNELGTGQRLALMIKVCDAVEHAHQKGVIHRDLKPGNILVDESANPKILDFGVARATDSDLEATTLHTDVGAIIGTLAYMSPEQAGGKAKELDTRSDVYALGVVTYELLTGSLPCDLRDQPLHEALRIIRETDPTPLSSINRALRGDVETIVAKALEKDRNRRYQSASDLAADISRYLRDEPITARRASATYQLRKFAQRNKALVVATVTSFLALAGAVVSTRLALREAKRSEVVALDERDKSEALADFLVNMLKAPDPGRYGRQFKFVDILDRAADELDFDFPVHRAVAARIHHALGSAYLSLKLYNAAEPHLTAALAAMPGEGPDAQRDMLTAITNMGLLRLGQSRFAEAERLLREALAGLQSLLGDDDVATLDSMNNLAFLLAKSGRSSEAEPLFRDALASARRLFGEKHETAARLMNGLGVSLLGQNKLPEAEAILRQSIESGLSLHDEEHPLVFKPNLHLATVLVLQGQQSEAELMLRDLAEMLPDRLGPEHPDTLTCIGTLGNVLLAQGKYAEAEQLLRRAVEGKERVLGSDHAETVSARNNLAGLLADVGRLQEAERLHRRTWQTRHKAHGEEHPATLVSLGGVAYMLHLQGKFSEAEELYRAVLAVQRRVQGSRDPYTLITVNNLGLMLVEHDALSEAEPLCREALEVRGEIFGSTHPHTLLSMRNFARLLHKQGKAEEAERLYRQTLGSRRDVLGETHPDTVTSMVDLADFLADHGNQSEAESIFEEVARSFPDAFPPEHWQTAVFNTSYGACLTKVRRYEEAQAHLLEGYQQLTSTFREDHPRVREAVGRLVSLYEAWDKPEKAAEYRAVLAKPDHFAPSASQ